MGRLEVGQLSNMIDNFHNNKKIIIDVKKRQDLNKIKYIFLKICKKILNKNIDDDLSLFHKYINLKHLNKFRVNVFEEINKRNIQEKLYRLCESEINTLCSNDLAVQKRINISFHLPNDKSSIIDLHSDTLSGQSPFEIVQWIPLCNVRATNSIYLFDNKKTNRINKNLKNFEKKGFNAILKKYLNKNDFIELKYGQMLLFSPTNWHGNTVNKTNQSRVSINLRYKPLFSPKLEFLSEEKGLGTFYKILNLSEASKIGLNYKLPIIK